MVKKILCLFALSVVLFLLFFDLGPKEGYVYKKRFVEEHTSVLMMPLSTEKTTTLMPVNYFHPDTYIIYIKDEFGSQNEWIVSKDKYDSIEVGDYFIYCSETDLAEPEKYKIK